MSVLQDIFYGRLRPFERSISAHPDYVRVVKSIQEDEKVLHELLNSNPKIGEELELYYKIQESYTKLSSIMELERFKDGLLLGVSMMIELALLTEKE